MAQKIILLVSFVMSVGLSAQGLDFEQTGFEIKAVAMQTEKSALAYHVSEKELPSRFTLGPVLKENIVVYSPVVQTSGNKQHPNISIAPLEANEVFAFGNDGAINGVKNTVYKAASGGNIYDAYCRGVYASRSSN